jgi:ribose transport system substrate-binding protein
LGVLAVASSGLYACGSDSENDDGGGGGAASGGEKKLRIGYVLPDLANPYIASLRDGAVVEAEKGGHELLVSGSNDSAEQTNAMLNYIGAQVDVIGVDAIDGKAIAPAVEKANEEGIPVIAVAAQPASGEVATFINADNVKGGELIGQAVVEYCKDIDPCKVGIVEGNPADQSGIDENSGMTSVVEGESNIEIVGAQPTDYDPAKALNVATNLLTANPDINYLYAWWDQGALSALEAVRAKGKVGKIGISGYGGNCENLALVIKGDLYQESVQFPDTMGAMFIQAAEKAVAGESLPESTPAPLVSVSHPQAVSYLDGSAEPDTDAPLLDKLKEAEAGCK